jgi:glycerate 2-kinase
VKGMAHKELRGELLFLAQKVLGELSPHRLIPRFLQRHGDTLFVGEQPYKLSRFRRIVAVGFGKAAGTMAEALEEILGDFLEKGLVITTPGQKFSLGRIEVREGGHPVPDERTFLASRELLDLIGDLGPDDLLFVLVSGGGSALFEVPAEGVSLEDLQEVNELLLKSGVTIQEMNIVRKHLSAVKGGQLLRHTGAGTIVVLVLSDVSGDDLGTIASGPTFPDPSTFAQAREILEARALWPEIPERVRQRLLAGEKGEIPETPKPGDPLFSQVSHILLCSGRTAAEIARDWGERRGFHAGILTTALRGEAREVAKILAGIAEEEVRFSRPFPPPCLLILSGETTVTVWGKGKGGRNQELALAFALEIAGLKGVALLALATDGKDGPTDAAGALVDGETEARCKAQGIDPRLALWENDAYRALKASGDLLFFGPTGTNVADLVVLGVEKC